MLTCVTFSDVFLPLVRQDVYDFLLSSILLKKCNKIKNFVYVAQKKNLTIFLFL